MKRIVLLTSLAAMMAAAMALSGVAQARPVEGKADTKCFGQAIRTLGTRVITADYNFVGGTEGNDGPDTFTPTAGTDVFCGFGGNDSISALREGDIFIGGAGQDAVGTPGDFGSGNFFGTFYGGADNDTVAYNYGTFYGEAGDDSVSVNYAAGTFNGEGGQDFVSDNYGTFYGGADDDLVYNNYFGTFYGEGGNDGVTNDRGGIFVQD